MTHATPEYIQEYFRIRSGDTEGLNADSGWAAAENTNATIDAGIFFRVRFKVRETAGAGRSETYKIQYNRNSGGWLDCTNWDDTNTEAVECWQSDQFVDNAATSTELLTNTGTYSNGFGSEDLSTGSITLSSTETEFEWCLMMQRTWGGTSDPGVMVDGDTIELRVILSDDTVFTGTYTNPTITVNLPDYYIGGAFTESPGRIGPIADSNGNLYMAVEYAVDYNRFCMYKSSDGGAQWTIQDAANRPTQGDLESVDMCLNDAGDDIHIIWQSTDVEYCIFRNSTHATNPDTWELTDENPETAGADADQCTFVIPRSDGTVVAFYRDSDGTNQRTYYRIRNGTWGTANNLDSTASVDIEDAVAVKEAGSDIIHIFYREATNEVIYHKSLNASDTLSSRETVESDPKLSNEWAMTTAVAWTSGSDEKVMIVVEDNSDNLLYSIQITNDGSPETRKAVSGATVLTNPTTTTSRQAVADIAVDSNGTVYCFYARSNGDIYRTELSDGGSNWTTDVLFQAAIRSTHYLRCQSFTHSGGNGGAEVVGLIYSEEVGNYTGRTFYAEYVIPAVGGGDVLNPGLSHIQHGVVASTGGGTSGLHPIEQGYIS